MPVKVCVVELKQWRLFQKYLMVEIAAAVHDLSFKPLAKSCIVLLRRRSTTEPSHRWPMERHQCPTMQWNVTTFQAVTKNWALNGWFIVHPHGKCCIMFTSAKNVSCLLAASYLLAATFWNHRNDQNSILGSVFRIFKEFVNLTMIKFDVESKTSVRWVPRPGVS